MTYEEYKKQEKERIERAIRFMEAGVTFADINTVFIGDEVEIGEGTSIGPCVTLEGSTKIGKDCRIYQNTRIVSAEIGDGVEITSSVILESSIGDGTKVGPFAYVRPNSCIGRNCKIGDFVEIKNSNFGDGSKSAHLTYIGDADVGSGVNLGCGVVFVNYDGSRKYRTEVGDDAFIGCNSNLISPVKVDDGTYIAAGSTVTDDVPEGALCIARARQKNIEGWMERSGLYQKKK
ncbi:MAG: UDP-N-acetylglucosamine diphosphorylase [Anaerovoracaceae bacterium]|jgi:bifunctional UDP-N-acetylglucosamine pyrophosphorylase/glucosamine-1-phosphate N-acetyltransferase